MDVAFSRDGSEKIYVQHRMKEQSRDIFAWLEEGAHVYVCGDAANMAPDVHSALIDIVASEASTGREAAEDYVRSLQKRSEESRGGKECVRTGRFGWLPYSKKKKKDRK